jgi:integrase
VTLFRRRTRQRPVLLKRTDLGGGLFGAGQVATRDAHPRADRGEPDLSRYRLRARSVEQHSGPRGYPRTQPQRIRKRLRRPDSLRVHKLEGIARFQRTKVIVRLLADTGIRANELIGVRQVDLVERGRDRFIKVHGKGAKDRLVPIAPLRYRRMHRVSRGRLADASVTGRFSLTVSGLYPLIRGLGEWAAHGRRPFEGARELPGHDR